MQQSHKNVASFDGSKISGCFRTEEFAKAYCRISSYLQTMASKGVNPLIAIQMALAGKID